MDSFACLSTLDLSLCSLRRPLTVRRVYQSARRSPLSLKKVMTFLVRTSSLQRLLLRSLPVNLLKSLKNHQNPRRNQNPSLLPPSRRQKLSCLKVTASSLRLSQRRLLWSVVFLWRKSRALVLRAGLFERTSRSTNPLLPLPLRLPLASPHPLLLHQIISTFLFRTSDELLALV